MPFEFTINTRYPKPATFSAKLKTRQCPATTAAHHQCKRTATVPYEYCWIHLRSKMHLRVKESEIPGGGLGLFADDPSKSDGAVVFKKGQTISKYRGEKLDATEVNNRYHDDLAPYTHSHTMRGKQVFVDAALKRGVAAIANHKPVSTQNSALVTPNGQAVTNLKAKKDIKNGSEIFASYGTGYLPRGGWKNLPRYSTKYIQKHKKRK